MKKHNNLILLRHGQSIWNQLNLFTGWVDVDLSDEGLEEAKTAGLILKNDGRKFDVIFTSGLTRSKHSAEIIKNVLGNSPNRNGWVLAIK